MIITVIERLFMSKQVTFCPKCGSSNVKRSNYLTWEHKLKTGVAKCLHKEYQEAVLIRNTCNDCDYIWYEKVEEKLR